MFSILPHRPALGAEDFLISQSNRAAADIIDRWPDWPQASVLVVAPPRAGKTHLANVWRLKSGAARLEAGALREADVAAAAAGSAVLVEDLHAGIGDERALFHLLNLVREHKLSMLLTSQRAGRRTRRRPAGPALAPAGAARSSPSRRRTRPCSRRCWSSISWIGNSSWSRM